MQLYQGTESLGVLQLPIHKEACKAEIQKAAHDMGKSWGEVGWMYSLGPDGIQG